MPKGKRKKAAIPENETNTQRFRRIVTGRCNNLGRAYNLITRLPKQPAYDVSQEDAKKLIAWVNEYHDAFIKRYDPIAKGEKVSRSTEKEVKPIF